MKNLVRGTKSPGHGGFRHFAQIRSQNPAPFVHIDEGGRSLPIYHIPRKRHENGTKKFFQKNKKIFQKPIDKQKKPCYNIRALNT